MRRFEIIKVGADGAHGHPGREFPGAGADGGPGTDGSPGTNAPATTINLSYDVARDCALITVSEDKTYHIPAAELASWLLSIKAYGGNGGSGGDGAPGSKGEHGTPGTPATYNCDGGNGGPGGNGGHGGDGGHGGNGGHGADIRIVVDPADTDLLMLLEKVDISGGRGGKAGKGGSGGAGGSGGSGGREFTWTTVEQRSEYKDYTDYTSKGPVTKSKLVYYNVSVKHSNPGGVDGPDGHPGAPGSNGRPGIDGRPGSFGIALSGSGGFYPDRYNLIVRSFCLNAVDNDGVIEPGEELFLQPFTLQNNGRMPTPQQAIQFELLENAWVLPTSEPAIITTRINPGQTYSLHAPVNFRIKPNFALVPNQIPRAVERLNWQALVRRVNKSFPPVAEQQKTLNIGYPVQMSLIHGAEAITRAEQAPIVLQLRNVSRRPIGQRAAAEARILKIEISTSSPHAAGLQWFPETGAPFSMAAGINYPIDVLEADHLAYLKATLKFRNPDIPFYTRVPLRVRLHLGDYYAPLTSSTVIQESTFTVQLSEAYFPNPAADFVLVINSSITGAVISQWQKMFREIKAQMSIWNVSLYSGIDYRFIRSSDGRSFMDELPGKVLIILNNVYQPGDRGGRQVLFDDLSMQEIYQAALEANISTYVVNPRPTNTLFYNGLAEKIAGVDYEHLEEEYRPKEEGLLSRSGVAYQRLSLGDPILRKTIIGNFNSWFSSPRAELLIEEARRIADKLVAGAPDTLHVVSYHFQPRVLAKGCFANTILVGTIQAWRCLSAVSAKVATKCNSDLVPYEDDFFNTLKLLPFAKKLSYLLRNYESDRVNLILDLILSDLTDEQYTWRQANWSGEFTRDRLRARLQCINMLRTFDFGIMLSSPVGREILRSLFVHYEAIIRALPSSFDYCWFYRRGRILTEICQQAINELIARVYNLKDAKDRDNLTRARNRYAVSVTGLTKADLALYFTDPSFRPHTYFQHYAAGAMVLNEDLMPSSHPVRGRAIAEGRYRFFEPGAAARRDEALRSFEAASHDDFRPAPLYPPETPVAEEPENLAATATFSGVVHAAIRPPVG